MTRDQARALLEQADLYAAADEDDRRSMIQNAVQLVGYEVTDSNGRAWIVAEVDTKDGRPTISGDVARPFWDRPEAVTVMPISTVAHRRTPKRRGAIGPGWTVSRLRPVASIAGS
jgi:hypothetical protein